MNFQHDQLISLTKNIFKAAGCHDEEAQRVANRLVESNLVGHDSHGVIRVPSYVAWLKDEKVFANKSITTVLDNDVVAVVDGQFGLGQTIGEQATQLGIEKSSKHGISVIALRNSGHLGRIGDWPTMAAKAGILSLHFVNTSGAGMLVAPFGGIDRRLSANPFAAGVPTAKGEPLVLDMSACTVAEGKVRVALNQGTTLPDGCLIDSDGNPTNDPKRFYADPPGAILPISKHKGSGLSLIIEMLAGALTGGSCTNPENAWRVANGMLSIYIDQKSFGAPDAFFEEVHRYIDFVKTSRTVTPDGEILMPGEIEQRTKANRLKHGIELDNVTWQQIHSTCERLNVKHDFPTPAVDKSAEQNSDLSIPGCESKPDSNTSVESK